MDKIDKKTIQEIKDYVRSLNTPENRVYQENSLLIMSCFSKAIEFIEANAKIREEILNDNTRLKQRAARNDVFEAKFAKIIELVKNGETIDKSCKIVGIDRTTLYREMSNSQKHLLTYHKAMWTKKYSEKFKNKIDLSNLDDDDDDI